MGIPLMRPNLPTLRLAAEDIGCQADERWAELDEGRRLPDDLFASLREAGFLRTLVPAQMGGVGTTPVEWMRLGLELARHDLSLGWVATQGAAELGWIAAGGDPAWAAEVLRDPHGASASSTAGMGTLVVDGRTAQLSGRWAFNTGSTGATWIGGLALVERPGTATSDMELRIGWVPVDRAEVLDDWDPSGMRGTGSNSTVIGEQTIDMAWTVNTFEQTPNDRGPHRVLVGNGNWPIATSVAAVQLGAARRAIDEATRIVLEKAPAPDFVLLANQGTVQRTLLRVEGRWNAALASVERELHDMWAEALRDEELTVDRRVRLLAANVHAAHESVAIIDEMCGLTGTVAMDRTQPLSRMRRDAQALASHLAVNGATMERAAKMRLGLIEADVRV